ncbi:hypothetical protein ABPG72_016545 [Tetrahymena utriculariae]
MLRDPAEKIKYMEEALQSIKDAKQEGANSVIQEMTLDEKKEWKSFPCDYDYVVEENKQLYIIYGWKQSKFPINKLPKKERDEILKDYNEGLYNEKINRVPLTDAQLSLFEDLLEENLSMDIIDELKLYYRLKKVTPVFGDDKDGYKKKIFEGFISAKKARFTIKIAGLKIDINPYDFLLRNGIHEERCYVQKKRIDDQTSEIFLGFENIRDYRRCYLILKARKYDLQEDSQFNQTKIVLKIIKQMYAEINKEFYNQIQSIRNCEHGEFDISPDLAVAPKPKNDKITKTKATNKIIKGKKVEAQYQSPPPMKPIEFGEDPIQKESEVENIEKPQNVKQTFSKEEIEKEILSIFGEEDTKQTQPDNKSDLSKDLTSLILDMKLVFQFLQNDKKCKNTKIATIKGNKRITHKQVLESISSYVQDLEKGQQLTIQQITSFEKIYTLKNVQNFIGYLKQNQSLDLSSLSSKLQILK